ncbi:hypothetical protein DICSQDRAFT_145383 [Dichomitus squalens LYAD-421 SS1]|uniref:uncharacterized protein n=1 Tax=Dichomitus squalens (strain LYAD-421) TaxID=732165 RepID=UPI0004410CF9|nr:uncharacterized protein DICSQDRAFT_145383 [Dichomitus squalens LYAD-421 SS1]EJF63916.1 hypothetical protein DICSQDRAFT_145383 [Dichomitus squalens LYAD-421 SS1]
MARTSQAHKGIGATVHGQHQVGVWIQYKGFRARTLQTTRLQSARSNLTASIVDEFLADLEALTLTITGVTMVDVRIVCGGLDRFAHNTASTTGSASTQQSNIS